MNLNTTDIETVMNTVNHGNRAAQLKQLTSQLETLNRRVKEAGDYVTRLQEDHDGGKQSSFHADGCYFHNLARVASEMAETIGKMQNVDAFSAYLALREAGLLEKPVA
jgi:hypothetical protein